MTIMSKRGMSYGNLCLGGCRGIVPNVLLKLVICQNKPFSVLYLCIVCAKVGVSSLLN